MINSDFLVGIDVGGTKTEIAVIHDNGQIVFRHRVITPSESYFSILNTISKLVDLARETCGLPDKQPIGLGIPGCVDKKTQKVRGANTRVLNDKKFCRDLTYKLKCKVNIENDANCLALSESVDGAAKNANLAFAVILGTGCGGGLSFQKKMLPGENSLRGEWGHNPMPWLESYEVSRQCWCGKKNCIETWLSGSGLSLTHSLNTGINITPIDIVNQARAGDQQCADSLDLYMTHLGKALASVVNLLDPDMIVIGGGLSQINEIYQIVPNIITSYSFTKAASIPLSSAHHGDSSGVRGAAWLSKLQHTGR